MIIDTMTLVLGIPAILMIVGIIGFCITRGCYE